MEFYMVRIISMNFTLVAWMGLMLLNEDKDKVYCSRVFHLKISAYRKKYLWTLPM